jgi:hypothetical protein
MDVHFRLLCSVFKGSLDRNEMGDNGSRAATTAGVVATVGLMSGSECNFFELELLRNCKQGFDQGIVFSLLRGTTHPACLIMTSHKEDVDERKSTDTELEGQNFKVMKCFLSKPTIFSCQGIQQRYMLLRNSKNNSSLNKMEQSFARRLYSGYALPYLESSMVKDASKASAEWRTTTESR